jgi:acyl carrier protein
MDLGLDSLAITQLVREISSSFNIQLSPTVVFDHPTVESLSSHLKNLLKRNMITINPATTQ